jgi:hypothetical protein
MAVGRTAQVQTHPSDHMAIMVSSAELAQVESDIRNVAAARNITVADHSDNSGFALDWEMVMGGTVRVEAVYDTYRNMVEICFFKADGSGDDLVTDFKNALRLGLARR